MGLLIGLVPSLYTAYLSDTPLPRIIEMINYLAVMLVPFMSAYVMLPDDEKKAAYCFDKPISAKAALAAIVAGLMFCTIGDIATDYFIAFLSAFGIELSGGEYTLSPTIEDFVFQMINIAVLPALIEEFALRSVVMQPLRRYGDKFAIVMSAFVFALMHGNLIQIPFAFIAGLAIGFFVIATGSIWVGVTIHFLNNTVSVVLSYVYMKDPVLTNRVYSLITAITLVAGIICTAVFMILCKRERLKNNQTILETSELVKTYIFTAAMIIAIILIAMSTADFVTITGVK